MATGQPARHVSDKRNAQLEIVLIGIHARLEGCHAQVGKELVKDASWRTYRNTSPYIKAHFVLNEITFDEPDISL